MASSAARPVADVFARIVDGHRARAGGRGRAARAPGALILALAAIGWAGCRAREDAFYDKVFSCPGNAGEEICGTSRQGKPMTCFAASQLGGENFCVESCDPERPPDDDRFVCLSSGALLQSCEPHPSAGGRPGSRCPAGLSCYRTDLLLNEGICIQMPVCTENTHCADERPVCAARLIRERSPSFPIQADNLQCVQSMCGAGRAMCPSGESCLGGFYDTSLTADYDICVPTCDGDGQCPPNFACALAPNASGSPSLCLPGLPGIRCHRDQDCAAGSCVDTGAGFNMCVLPFSCRSNEDCATFNGPAATFLCAEGVPGAGKRCILRQSFGGTLCRDEDDCPAGFICAAQSPLAPEQRSGECRLPCGPDGSCPARGGIPHVCVRGGPGGCYPTGFGLPCAGPADCLPELECLAVGPDERAHASSPKVCTLPCRADSDCSDHFLIVAGGFCRKDEGVCRVGGSRGDPCERDAQCFSSSCVIDTAAGGAGKCGG